MENDKYTDSNFGITIFNIINELNQNLIKTLAKNGKTDDEVKEYFESDEYGKIYIDTCNMLIESLSANLEKYILEDEENKKERDLYLKHLQSIWGHGISWMKRYLIICADICDGFGWYINQSHIVSDRCNVFNALHAIHGKALLVYAEIICLLENGFPDGAFAHYRMLYELWAVAEFLYNDTDDISRAYIESADDKLEKEEDHYKWATTSECFSNRENKITIYNIITEAHRTFTLRVDNKISKTKLKNIYLFPNAIIHPSAKGVFGRTSNPIDNEILIGSADTGLSTPSINSSKTMFNITHLFLSMIPNSASSIGLGVLNNIIGQRIIPFFEDIEKTQKI